MPLMTAHHFLSDSTNDPIISSNKGQSLSSYTLGVIYQINYLSFMATKTINNALARFGVTALVVASGLSLVISNVNAQTTTVGSGNSVGVEPVLYNQQGSGATPVNTTSGTSPAPGYYYLADGSQVYYYGNGTFYNISNGTYGGSVHDPSGLAGTYYYNAAVPTGTVTSPGFPNTGAGGNVLFTLLMLAGSAAVVVAGGTYLRKSYAR
jgi:hypothetical protein